MIYSDQEDPNVKMWNKQNETSTKTFYDLHVFYSRDEGFSVGVQTDEPMEESEVIKKAIADELIDSEDARQVDYIEEIDEDDYNNLIVE